MSAWTDDRVERLTQLWNGGKHSCSAIAGELGGITRNAVIGKATRLGLQSRRNSPAARKPKPPRPARSLWHNGAGYVQREPIEEQDAAPDFTTLAAFEAQPRPDNFLCVPLLKLEEKHCRYPREIDGVMAFCGQAKLEGSSYCAACHKRCHTHGGYTLNISEAERNRRRALGLAQAAINNGRLHAPARAPGMPK